MCAARSCRSLMPLLLSLYAHTLLAHSYFSSPLALPRTLTISRGLLHTLLSARSDKEDSRRMMLRTSNAGTHIVCAFLPLLPSFC